MGRSSVDDILVLNINKSVATKQNVLSVTNTQLQTDSSKEKK
jgi:hypothetical protein